MTSTTSSQVELTEMQTLTQSQTDRASEARLAHIDFDPGSQEQAAIQEDIPPDGGWGWVCVFAIWVLNTQTWGISSAFGVFLAYYLRHNTFPSATPIDFAFIGGLSISQALMVAPLITMSTRKFGTRTTLMIGVILQTCALVGASFANRIWHLYLTQGFGLGWGMGFMYIGSMGIIPQWFSSRRSLAVGITASGAGIGGILYNLVSSAAIQSIGLPWTFRTLAAASGFANFVCAMLVRDRNHAIQPKQTAFDFTFFRRPEFLLVVGWGSLSELGYIVLFYSLPHYADSIGLSAQQGAMAGALLNLGLAVGRPPVGYLSDRGGRINVAMACTAFCGLLCMAVWVFASTYAILLTFALLAGTVCGTFWCTIAPVGAEVIGLKELQPALSMAWILLVLPCTFAEPIAVKMLTSSHNWLHSQLFVGFMFMGAAGCTWLLRSWKIDQVERKAAAEQAGVRFDLRSASGRSGLQDLMALLRKSFLLQKV